MRFLIDQDVYRITIDELKEWGHDVVTAKELGMQQASDQDLLRKAREIDRLLITRDKDFGINDLNESNAHKYLITNTPMRL